MTKTIIWGFGPKFPVFNTQDPERTHGKPYMNETPVAEKEEVKLNDFGNRAWVPDSPVDFTNIDLLTGHPKYSKGDDDHAEPI